MTTGLENAVSGNISSEEVAKIVAESLELDYDSKIQWNSLRDLDAEDIDIADIFFKLKIPFQKYFCGASDKLTDKGKSVLAEIACELLLDGEEYEAGRIALMRQINSLDSIKDYMDPFIISYIARYAAKEKSTAPHSL